MKETKLEVISINEDVIATSYICSNVTGISPYSYTRYSDGSLQIGNSEGIDTVNGQCTVNGVNAGTTSGYQVFEIGYHYHVITGGTDPINEQAYKNFWICNNPDHYKDFN